MFTGREALSNLIYKRKIRHWEPTDQNASRRKDRKKERRKDTERHGKTEDTKQQGHEGSKTGRQKAIKKGRQKDRKTERQKDRRRKRRRARETPDGGPRRGTPRHRNLRTGAAIINIITYYY